MTEAIELATGFDLDTIRQASEGPVTGPLSMRLQEMIRQMLPAYAAALSQADAGAAVPYEPSFEEKAAFRDGYENKARYRNCHVVLDDLCLSEGLRRARAVRP